VTSAGKYHMGKGNVNNCTTSVCSNTISQPSVESTSGSVVINVTSDMFASNSPVHELTVPNFYDSSKQIVLHFLRDLDEY
jgi:short-subunit dehydrogenase